MDNATKTIDEAVTALVQTVNGFRNATDRSAFVFGTMKRTDADWLRVACDAALERGLVQYGKAHAQASDGLLYVTKLGRAMARAA